MDLKQTSFLQGKRGFNKRREGLSTAHSIFDLRITFNHNKIN